MKTKLVTVRFPAELHKALVDYCEPRFLPMSSLILQLVAKEVGYKPRPAATRTDDTPMAPQYWDGAKFVATDEDDGTVDFTPEELEELQRRASATPLRPV